MRVREANTPCLSMTIDTHFSSGMTGNALYTVISRLFFCVASSNSTVQPSGAEDLPQHWRLSRRHPPYHASHVLSPRTMLHNP
ncbi:hypothetical protein E2C01_006354 [Portunus trituberculatus]|uniref:Uncharacterized protein n=1 Tax=Portunus trituberculatus TaxID=210409 RepID=A0A5B7CXZ4_PORTR|nr:hypothetical protein [Portunus trituberculatus]